MQNYRIKTEESQIYKWYGDLFQTTTRDIIVYKFISLQVGSFFPHSHSPMERLFDTTRERSGLGPGQFNVLSEAL